MVDMVPVPQRLEDTVGKAQHHDVLDCLLAQEMVHPVDLRLRNHIEELSVERVRRGKIGAERLLDDDASPATFLLLGESGFGEPLDDRPEQGARDGKIENHVAASTEFRFDLLELLREENANLGAG